MLRGWLDDAPEPGPETRDAILARVAATGQRPRLAASVVGHPAIATSFRAALAAAAAIAVLAVVPPLLWPEPSGPAATPGPRVVIGQLGSHSTASITLDGVPVAVTVDATSAWLTTRDRTLLEVDRSSLRTLATFDLPANPCGAPAIADRVIWVASCDGHLLRVDGATGAVASVPGSGLQLGVTASAIWTLDALESSVQALDPASGDVLRSFRLEGQSDAVLAGLDAIWVFRPGDGRVVRVDPTSGAMVSIVVGDRTYAGTLGADRVWVADFSSGAATAISPSGELAGSIEGVGTGPTAIAATADRIWVIVDGGLAVVDTGRLAKLETIDVDPQPGWIAAFGTELWLVDGTTRSLTRLDTLP